MPALLTRLFKTSQQQQYLYRSSHLHIYATKSLDTCSYRSLPFFVVGDIEWQKNALCSAALDDFVGCALAGLHQDVFNQLCINDTVTLTYWVVGLQVCACDLRASCSKGERNAPTVSRRTSSHQGDDTVVRTRNRSVAVHFAHDLCLQMARIFALPLQLRELQIGEGREKVVGRPDQDCPAGCPNCMRYNFRGSLLGQHHLLIVSSCRTIREFAKSLPRA